MSPPPPSCDCREGFRYNLFLVPKAQTYLYGVCPDPDVLSMERAFDAFGEYLVCRLHGLSDTHTLDQLYASGFLDPHLDRNQVSLLFGMAYIEMGGAVNFMEHHSGQHDLVVASATLRPLEREYGEPGYFYVVHAVPLEDFRDNPYRPVEPL